MNRLKVSLNEVKARKLKDLQEKVNFNRNRINDTSHEARGVMTLHDYGYLPPEFLKSYPVSE